MLNQAIVVGRLVKEPELKKTENGASYGIITLACQRSFKNADGVYETDFIDFKIFGQVAEATAEYCKKGDVIGARARIQTKNENDKNVIELIADKITFLSNKKSDE